MTPWAAVALGFGLAAAGLAAGWLTRGGMPAAGLVGSAVLAGTGVSGGMVLALFFVSGSVLTRWNAPRAARARTARTASQVLANGLWAATGALMAGLHPTAGWSVLAGALAAAQADTWATEIGAHAHREPRLITTGKPVPTGTSGGVTWRGTLGGVGGGVILAAVAAAVGAPPRAALAGLAGGLGGLFADSFLGATVQARFHCEPCDRGTEQRVHTCGRPAGRIRGWTWLDNDGVNLVATGLGAGTALLVSWWL